MIDITHFLRGVNLSSIEVLTWAVHPLIHVETGFTLRDDKVAVCLLCIGPIIARNNEAFV